MKHFKNIMLAGCLIASLFMFSACEDDATLATLNESQPSYGTVITEIDEYTSAYSEYMASVTNDENAYSISVKDSYTASGIPCCGTLLTTTEGGYQRLTVQIEYETNEVVDEYFKVSDSLIFIARTTSTDDSTLGTVEKYCIIDGTLYSINDDSDELTPVEQPDTLDFYLSWSEIEETYGG